MGAANAISSFGMPPGRPDINVSLPDKGPAARDSDEGSEKANDNSSKTGRAGNLSDAEIVSQIERYRNEAFMREYIIRNNWLDCYGQYRNKQDFDDKAPWQSRITFAKAHSAVKNFVAQIMRLLQQSEQWITVEPGEVNPTVDLKRTAPLVEKVVLRLLDNAHFRSQFRDALEFGAICGMGVLKIGWAYQNKTDLSVGGDDTGPMLVQKQRKEGQLYVQSIDPFHIWFGPRTRDNNRFDFIIEETLVDVDELKSQKNLENTTELEHVDRIADQMYFADQVYTRDFARYDKRQIPAEHYRKQALVWEYWGDVVDVHTQKIVDSNVHILIANRTTVLKYEKNPYWDSLPPYIVFSPLVVAGRFPGQGLLEMNMSVKDGIDRLAQMQEDHLKFSVVPMMEVEASALENPEGDMQTGVQPGKVFLQKSWSRSWSRCGRAVSATRKCFVQLSDGNVQGVSAGHVHHGTGPGTSGRERRNHGDGSPANAVAKLSFDRRYRANHRGCLLESGGGKNLGTRIPVHGLRLPGQPGRNCWDRALERFSICCPSRTASRLSGGATISRHADCHEPSSASRTCRSTRIC